MPTSLENIRLHFNARLVRIDMAYDRHVATGRSRFRQDRYALQEGMISHLWQTWCYFCRTVIVESVKGAETSLGAITHSVYSHHTDREIAYIARKLSCKQNIGIVKSITGSHMEPTWGDINKIPNIVGGLQTSNHSNIQTGLSLAVSLLDLQSFRNACAHLNKDRISDIISAKVRYSDTNFYHPSDTIFWEDPKTKNFLWKTWIDEMIIASEYAIK